MTVNNPNPATADALPMAFPHNLPAQLAPLIDRAEEIQVLLARLRERSTRLITLTGMGGIGKTRLALEGAWRLASAAAPHRVFADGIFFVSAEDLTTTTALAAAVARAVDFRFDAARAADAQLLDFFRAKRLLLVLDNLEPHADVGTLLSALLAHAAGVSVLVTSRLQLHLAGEWIMEVAGLAYAPAEAAQPAEFPATQLFLQRAEAQPGRAAIAAQVAAVADICRQLEGLPLGIELAASAASRYTCVEIAAAIRQSLDFLATTHHDLPPRHRALRAVFDYAWTRLTPQAQAAFLQLSVFVGGFSAQAAAAVAGVERTTLVDLAEQSLLQRRYPTTAADGLEFRLHPTLRQYANIHLEAEPALAAALRARHRRYYCTLVAAAHPALYGPTPEPALVRLAQQVDNLCTAWLDAVAHADWSLLSQSLSGLARYYLLRGPLADWQNLLDAAIAQVRSALVHEEVAVQALLASLLGELARVLVEQGKYGAVLPVAQEAVALAQQIGSLPSEAFARLQWGRALNFQSQYADATQVLGTGLAQAQQAQAAQLEAEIHAILGGAHLFAGQFVVGLGHYERAVELLRSQENVLDELKVRYSQAVVLFFTGEYVQAKTIYEECIARYRAIGDRRSVGMLLNNLAAVHGQLGAYLQAEEIYREALALKRAAGDRRFESLILANLGHLATAIGEYETAANYCRQAMTIGRELGEQNMTAYAQTYLGHALAGLGWSAEAAVMFAEALQLRQALGQRDQMAEPLTGLAAAYLAMDNPREALTQIEQILPQLKYVGAAGIVEPARIHLVCYRVLQANQDGRAAEVLRQGYELITARAAKIPDVTLRTSFLENVAIHRQLIAVYQQKADERPRESTARWRQRMDHHLNLTRDLESWLGSNAPPPDPADDAPA